MRSLWIGGSGLMSQQKNIDALGHNISNVNTNGYKRNRVSFNDLMYANLQQNEDPIDPELRQTPEGIQLGNGAQVATTNKMFKQGTLNNTGKTWDLGIQGEGFFGVEIDGQTYLTRDGNFSVDSEGNLVTSEGHFVSGDYLLDLNEVSEVSVDSEGNITAMLPGAEQPQYIGSVNTFNVDNPEAMLAVGDNLYLPSEISGEAEFYNAEIQQGVLEGSNVDLAEQFSRLIVAQRSYESNAKLIHSADEMMSHANNIKR